jgi:hypothetical protein
LDAASGWQLGTKLIEPPCEDPSVTSKIQQIEVPRLARLGEIEIDRRINDHESLPTNLCLYKRMRRSSRLRIETHGHGGRYVHLTEKSSQQTRLVRAIAPFIEDLKRCSSHSPKDEMGVVSSGRTVFIDPVKQG